MHCGSKALNGPESRYAACEVETLGIYFALIECKHYLVGMTEFTVLSDHKLLKGLFAKNLAAVDNIRMRQCMERLQEFNCKVNHIVGKKTPSLIPSANSPQHQPRGSQENSTMPHPSAKQCRMVKTSAYMNRFTLYCHVLTSPTCNSGHRPELPAPLSVPPGVQAFQRHPKGQIAQAGVPDFLHMRVGLLIHSPYGPRSLQ